MYTTPNMGLTAWDLGTDPYDHSQLAANFAQIDLHDHSTGKGLQIQGSGIANNAITSSKIAANQVVPSTHIPSNSITELQLAANSVGNSELADDSVTTAIIANSSVTIEKLHPSVIPVGMVIMWYRADASVLPPTGWEIMDGRAWSTITNKLGAGGTQWNTGNIPNMANKFPLGSALAGTGTGVSTPPGIGSTGGFHERDLSHTHTTNAHSHTVDNHAHGITADGGHNHRFWANTQAGAQLRDLFSRDVGVPKVDGRRQALYIQEHNRDSFAGSDVAAPMESVAAHSHGGSTTNSTAGTSSSTVTVNNGLTGNTDLRPAHVGLLFLMKVL
jgi:hypothetical protein